MTKEKENLRIVYMGTPEFAVAGLEALLEQNFQVVGVVTAPDRPSGRGRKLQSSAVKKYALEKGIPVLQPLKLRDEGFLTELAALKADLQVIVAFRMLPKVVWDMPPLGTFNLHASLLPQYRGAAPINWALINGETESGVTTFFIDEKIDTGAILLQERCSILPEENAGQLHDKLMALGASLIVKTVELIAEGKAQAVVQEESDQLKEAPKIHKETCEIDWSQSLEQLHNFTRGLSPYPAAWTTLYWKNGQETQALGPVKILQLDSNSSAPESTEKGQTDREKGLAVLQIGKQIWIKHPEGWLRILEMQIPGKRKMLVQDLLNGWQLEEGTWVE